MSRIIIDQFKDEYEFLSNYHKRKFVCFSFQWKGYRIYKTNEHFYQSEKAINPLDRESIINAPTPGKAKQLGRIIKLVPHWKFIDRKVMYRGLLFKFSIPELHYALMATYDAILIEGNYWHDNYWGDCKCKKCSNIEGKNNLGKLLMKLRFKKQNPFYCKLFNVYQPTRCEGMNCTFCTGRKD